jgi:hypothetical protein
MEVVGAGGQAGATIEVMGSLVRWDTLTLNQVPGAGSGHWRVPVEQVGWTKRAQG